MHYICQPDQTWCTLVSYSDIHVYLPGRVAQSVGIRLISRGSWVRYPVWPHTFVSPSAFSRRAVVSYWRKYVHEVLVNRLGGLSLPRKSVVRLTDRPDMTLDVYRGRKTTNQQINMYIYFKFHEIRFKGYLVIANYMDFKSIQGL